MITPKTITRRQAKRLVKLLEWEARCDIMSRLGRVTNKDMADYAKKRIECMDEIRELLFDSSNLLVLAEQWELIKRKRRKKKK
jgi:hypothetical protein